MKTPHDKQKLGSDRDGRTVRDADDKPLGKKRAGRALSRRPLAKDALRLATEGVEAVETKVGGVRRKSWAKHSDTPLARGLRMKRARP